MRDFHIGPWTLSVYRRDLFARKVQSGQPMVERAMNDEAEGEPISRGPESWPEHPVIVERAERLLQEHLTEAQRTELAMMNAFPVVGSLGNRYSIRRGRTRNVVQLNGDGEIVRWLCAGPENVPEADLMLAQKCLIEADELAFAFLSNTYTPRRARNRRDDADANAGAEAPR